MFLRGCQPLGLLSFVFLVVKSSDFSGVPMFHSTDDQKRNTVALLFEDVTLSNWNTGNKTAFLQEIILDIINLACSNNPSRCSLTFWNDSRKFNIRHVVVVESPKEEEKDLLVKLFVSLPDGSDIRNDNRDVIPAAKLQEILQAHKNNITSVVFAEIKSISMASDSDSKDSGTDNKMNYIMIPVSFSVLIVLCFVACCLHCASKRRRKAIDIERRKQTLGKLRASTSKSAEVNSNSEGRVPTQNVTDENVSMTVIHEDTRKKTRQKQRTERSYVNNEQQEQFENDEERAFARKRKTKGKQSKHQRLEGPATLKPAVLSGQWEEGEERVPTPMPVHRSLNKKRDPERNITSEPHQRKNRKKTRKKKTRSELREFDEGFDEGSESRRTENSEDSLIKSLPRPRQLAPLQERSPATIQL